MLLPDWEQLRPIHPACWGMRVAGYEHTTELAAMPEPAKDGLAKPKKLLIHNSEKRPAAAQREQSPVRIRLLMKTYIAAELSAQENYKLLAGSILPRPIAFVSTIDERGVRNLAPFSFCTVASANPPIVLFCPLVRPPNAKGLPSIKDTLSNIKATKEFVLNIVSESFVGKMNETAAEVPAEVDEWELSGLTALASEAVQPPRVGESRVQMECRLVQLVVASAQPLGGTLVLGEVLRFHVADEIIDDQLRIHPGKLDAVGRMAGATYTRTRDRFDLERPK